METNIVLEKIFKVAKSCSTQEQGVVAKAYIAHACKLYNMESIKLILDSLVDISVYGSKIRCRNIKN